MAVRDLITVIIIAIMAESYNPLRSESTGHHAESILITCLKKYVYSYQSFQQFVEIDKEGMISFKHGTSNHNVYLWISCPILYGCNASLLNFSASKIYNL